MSDERQDASLALLKWYASAGVDEVIGNEAAALYAAAPPPEAPAAPAPVSLRPQSKTPKAPSPEEVAQKLSDNASALAKDCTSLEALKAAMEAFDGKAHFPAAKKLVFADGNPEANVMLIGEAPGAEEDRVGKPFVGRAGKLLDAMLVAIGLDRTSVYITNIIPWRPLRNRTPSSQEGVIFLPFLMRHIALAQPKMIVALGGSAAKLLLDTNQGITQMRGQWREIEVEGRKIPVLPTLHPAYLLRTPLSKREAWADLLNLKQRLKQPAQD